MVKYIIKPECKLVVCVLHDKYTGRTFKGVAHCAEGDTWNEEIGKVLAFTRAQINETIANINTTSSAFNEALEACNKAAMEMQELKGRRTYLYDNLEKHLRVLNEVLRDAEGSSLNNYN